MRPTDVLREAGATMDETLLHMRQRLWQTPEEVEVEIEELRLVEAMTPLRPPGRRWQDVLERHWHRWRRP